MKTRAIVVGTGGFAWCHIRAMVGMRQNTELVGFVEPSEASRKATAGRLRENGASCPRFYSTIRELVRAQGPADAAVICSPHKFHFENARDCMEHGMDVCMEKPMVMSIEENRNLRDAVERAGVKSIVSFVLRWIPLFDNIKSLINAGAIGELFYVEADYWHGLGDFWT